MSALDTNQNFRQAGKETNGRLIKGWAIDPINKATSSSIPYKFETILYKNNNPRGFGGSSQRFYSLDDAHPGPGSYESKKAIEKEDIPSFSKKGLGNGFVSGTQRVLFKNFINSGPGPGSYNAKDHPFTIKTKIQQNFMTSSNKNELGAAFKRNIPGPGEYNPRNPETDHNKIVTSVFRSKTVRHAETVGLENPPPGSYNLDRSLVPKKPFKHFLSTSSFMMPSRPKKSDNKEKVDQLLGKEQPPDGKHAPGPGAYFTDMQNDDTFLLKQSLLVKPSSTFVESNKTRFGESIVPLAKKIITPGPGNYDREFEPAEKTLVSGSVFMSESLRRPFGEVRRGVGPTSYNSQLLPKKKSYHLNMEKKWV